MRSCVLWARLLVVAASLGVVPLIMGAGQVSVVPVLAPVPPGFQVEQVQMTCLSSRGPTCVTPGRGVDLMFNQGWSDAGRPIVAPVPGTVTSVDTRPDGAVVVTLQTRNGIQIQVMPLVDDQTAAPLVGTDVASGVLLGAGVPREHLLDIDPDVSLIVSAPPPYLLEGKQLPWRDDAGATQRFTFPLPMPSSNTGPDVAADHVAGDAPVPDRLPKPESALTPSLLADVNNPHLQASRAEVSKLAPFLPLYQRSALLANGDVADITIIADGPISASVWITGRRMIFDEDLPESRDNFRLAADWTLRWMESHGVVTSNLYVRWGDRQYQRDRGEHWLGY